MLEKVLAVAVGVALVAATVALLTQTGPHWRRTTPHRGALQLVLLSAAWLLVNSPFEGRVLWRVVPNHGLTQADVLVVPPLLVAALLLLGVLDD